MYKTPIETEDEKRLKEMNEEYVRQVNEGLIIEGGEAGEEDDW